MDNTASDAIETAKSWNLHDVAETIRRQEQLLEAAETLCQIYWEIAEEALGEDEVRRRRQTRIDQLEGENSAE